MEAWTDYDAYTKRYLGMSGEEFGVRWDRGEFNDEFEFPDSIGASMMRCEKPAEADAREHDAG